MPVIEYAARSMYNSRILFVHGAPDGSHRRRTRPDHPAQGRARCAGPDQGQRAESRAGRQPHRAAQARGRRDLPRARQVQARRLRSTDAAMQGRSRPMLADDDGADRHDRHRFPSWSNCWPTARAPMPPKPACARPGQRPGGGLRCGAGRRVCGSLRDGAEALAVLEDMGVHFSPLEAEVRAACRRDAASATAAQRETRARRPIS